MPAVPLTPDGRVSHAPDRGGHAHRRNPRVWAAFAYAIPFLPALWLLVRERRNRFVRLHAARSLSFFGGLALAQIVYFAALIAAGGAVTGLTVAALLGVIFYALYILLAALSFVFWLLLMRDALAGKATAYPLLGRWSQWLEARITRAQNRLFPLRAG
jgi:uncharacterized membrane protein